ncbi:MAG: arsenic transporter [Alphaproteobacteria bacterium]|nr:arsenic transporter [Alphaproteobacteria bacterium]
MIAAPHLIWAIAAVATSGIILRPWRLPEAVWAVAGAVVLVGAGLLPWREALGAVGKGTDVYLFLIGMMLLAELAREEGLFDHVAARAARRAKGSARRLFALVYAVGIVVTVFLSNDATAVVLTPAVYAAAKAAKAEPLPHLLACAFIANAASFVLPISNPANLVIFASRMPPLFEWLARFALPSVLSIAATYVALRLTQATALGRDGATEIAVPPLSSGGRLAAWGIGATAIVLIGASAADIRLGLPTCLAGMATACIVMLRGRAEPWRLVKGVSWAILPLVAGLFVLVEGLVHTGVIAALSQTLQAAAQHSVIAASWGAGIVLALVCNLMNNLPAGLIAGSAVAAAPVPVPVTSALLIAVDLGPNLSVTGSLATILWLLALRREGQHIGTWRFLKLGAVVMPPALILALAGLSLAG